MPTKKQNLVLLTSNYYKFLTYEQLVENGYIYTYEPLNIIIIEQF